MIQDRVSAQFCHRKERDSNRHTETSNLQMTTSYRKNRGLRNQLEGRSPGLLPIFSRNLKRKHLYTCYLNLFRILLLVLILTLWSLLCCAPHIHAAPKLCTPPTQPRVHWPHDPPGDANGYLDDALTTTTRKF